MSIDSVRLTASALDIYETIYTDCPFCQRLNKMGITRTPEGALYNCFSNGCQAKGFIPDSYGNPRPDKGKVPVKARRYVGRFLDWEEQDAMDFQKQFGFIPTPGWVHVSEKDEYLLPIRQPYRIHTEGSLQRVGEVLRQPWSGFRRKGREGMPKALTYLEHQAPRLAFYYPGDYFCENMHLVIVEDQVSAMKIAKSSGSFCGVALLGNSMNEQSATKILQTNPRTVSIWLDPDMNAKAFEMNAEYGSSFPGCRVILSDADPKDSVIAEHLYD